jgi:hypothetical protein
LAAFTLLASSEREQAMRRFVFALTSIALLGSVVGCHCVMGKCDCDPICPCGTACSGCGGCGCGGGGGHWFGDHNGYGDHTAPMPADHPNGPYAPGIPPGGTPVIQTEHVIGKPSGMESMPAGPSQPLAPAPRTLPTQPSITPLSQPILP